MGKQQRQGRKEARRNQRSQGQAQSTEQELAPAEGQAAEVAGAAGAMSVGAASGAGGAGFAQAQMMNIAMTQGNAAAQAAMKSANATKAEGAGVEEEEGGHATEEPAVEETAADPVADEAAGSPTEAPSPDEEEESTTIDGGTEVSEGAAGDDEPPVGTEALPGGEPNPSGESEEPPELGAEEKEGEESNADAEGEEQAAEEGEVAAAEGLMAGVVTAPLMPTMTPTLGVGASPKLTFGVSKEENKALVETTGMGAEQHAAMGNTALEGLANSATALQAESVDAAVNAGLTVKSNMEALLPVLDQEAATVGGQVGQAFDTGTATLQGAAETARVQIDAGSTESQAGVEAKRVENIGQIDAVTATTQAGLQNQKQTWSQSFDSLETGYAEKFEKAPEDAGDAVLGRKQEIGDEQATGRGPGGAVSRLMDKKRTQAGVIQAEQAAERIRVEGKIEGPTPVEEIGEPGMVEEWVEPLEERVGTFREDSVSALTETATASQDAIATGGEEWKTQVELDEQGAVSQMDEDKLAAQGEVSAVGVQLRGDLESQIVSQESLFTEASAQFADSYRLHVDTVSQAVSTLPLVTGEEAEEYVADQEVALQDLHQENLATLGSLVDTTTTELTQQVDTGRVQLQTLLSENQTDIEGVTATKVESFNEMGVAYSDSLGGMSDAIQGEMQLWTDPLESQSSDFVEAAETSLQTQHDSADEELSQSLGQYEECLDEQVAEVGEHVEADPAGAPADETLEKICEDSKDSIAGMGTKENKLYNALRLIEDKKKSPEFAAAVESKWSDVNRSDNESLLEWIDGDMDGREYRIAYNYYKGNTSKAAELELDYCTAWYNDDEAQIEAILRGLDKDQLEEMQARDSWKEVGDELQDDLDGTDINVVDALLVNNAARADAYRLKDKVDAARRKNDHDALHDALAGMDPATRQTIVQEFSYIQTDGAVAGATEVELPEWEAAMSEMQTYVTRDIQQTMHTHDGHTHTYTNSITGANKNLAESLIESGNDSVESDVHRFEVERSRRGGPKESRMEEALYMSSGSQDALRRGELDPAFKDTDAYQAALKEKEERLQFEAIYAQHNYNDGKTVDEGIQELYRGTEDGRLEIEVHQKMLEEGTNSPEVVALITELSTNDMGTKDERLQRAWDNLTPAQAAEARQVWEDRPDLGAGKDLEDFFFNDSFSELSGDDARKMQEKMLGAETYMNDEQLFELAELRADYQLGDSTYLSDEELNIQGHRDELRELIATVRSERIAQGLGDSAYEDGVFQGTAEQKERYAELNRYIGITVRQEMAREDMVAGYFTQAIAIVGGVIVIVLTGGGAAPLVIGLATAATGGASIAANQIIKGDRYGYEQALLDGGVTLASALTAGTGAHLSRLNDVAKGGTGIVLAGRKLSEQSGKVFIALATDGADAFVGSVLNDQTWEESGGGLNDVLLATAKGTGMSLAGDAISGRLDNSVLGKIAGEDSSVIANMTQDAVKGYTEDFLKTGLSLTVDSATGKFNGDFGDALVAMNEAGMSGAGTSVLNEFFVRATPEGAFDGTALGQSSKAGTLNTDGSERTVGDAFSQVGTGLSEQVTAIPGELAQLHSDVTGLTALQNEFNAQLPGIVALHPDVVAQLADFESTEIEARTQGEADDKEQAAILEGTIQSEEGPEAIAEQVESLSEDKQEVIENRADEGETEIQAYVEASDKAEVELVEAFDASVVKIEEELSSEKDTAPAVDAVPPAVQSGDQSTPDNTKQPGSGETVDAQALVMDALNLDAQQAENFGGLLEHEVQLLIAYHKEHGDAGEVLRDIDRLEQVVGIVPEPISPSAPSAPPNKDGPVQEDLDATVIMNREELDPDATVIMTREERDPDATEIMDRSELVDSKNELKDQDSNSDLSYEELEPAVETPLPELSKEDSQQALLLSPEETGTFSDLEVNQVAPDQTQGSDQQLGDDLPKQFGPLDVSEDLPGAVGIDERGLMHGPGYLEDQAQLAAQLLAYDNRVVHGKMRENWTNGENNAYVSNYAHDVHEGPSVTTVVQRMYLDLDSDVTPAARAHAIQQIHAGVEKVYNAAGHEVAAAHGGTNTLRVEIQIVDSPGDAHYTVNLHDQQGSGRADSKNYYTWDDMHVHAHEGFHNIFGGLDEYEDSRVPTRETHEDRGIMSNNVHDTSKTDSDRILHPGEDQIEGNLKPHPDDSNQTINDDVFYSEYHEDVGLRERNIQHIQSIIEGSRQSEGNWQQAPQSTIDAHNQEFEQSQQDRRLKYEHELQIGRSIPTIEEIASYDDFTGVTEVWDEGEAWTVRRLFGDEGQSALLFNEDGDIRQYSAEEVDAGNHLGVQSTDSQIQDSGLEQTAELPVSIEVETKPSLLDGIKSFFGMGSPSLSPQALDSGNGIESDPVVSSILSQMDSDGSTVAAEVLRSVSDPESKRELAQHFVVLHELTKRPVESLTTDELISVVRANHALVQQYQVHDTKMRRVVGEGEIGGWLKGTKRDWHEDGTYTDYEVDRSTTSGSIGMASNTEGMAVQDIVSVLGLDYNDDGYVRQDDGRFTAKETAFFLETPMTTEIMEKAKVPVGSDVYGRIEDLAKTDSQAAELLERIKADDIGKSKDESGTGRGALNPFTGVGITAPSERLAGGRHTIAPELKISGRVSIPEGAQLFHQTSDGNPVLVGVYRQDHDGRRYWEISSDCPVEFRARFEELARLGKR